MIGASLGNTADSKGLAIVSPQFDINNKPLKALTTVEGEAYTPTALTIASTLVALIVNTIFVLLNSLENLFVKIGYWQSAKRTIQNTGCILIASTIYTF